MKRWVLPAATIVAVEYLFALLIGAQVGFHYEIPFVAYAITAIAIVGISAASAIIVRLFIYARQGEPHPTRRLLDETPRFAGFATGIILVALQMGALTWTKIMLPIATGFWADPMLANVDHAIFHAEPWKVAYRLFGWAEPMIDKTYISWAPIKFATLLVLVSLEETEIKARALRSYFILMALVAVGQYLLPSAGPLLFDQMGFGRRFAALPIEPWVGSVRSYLWQDYLRGGGKIGTGISAMPSLHVAISLWVALVVRDYKPKLAPIGFAYFAVILIGSVLLGWHYAVDGLAATAIALTAWKAGTMPQLYRGRGAVRANVRSALS